MEARRVMEIAAVAAPTHPAPAAALAHLVEHVACALPSAEPSALSLLQVL